MLFYILTGNEQNRCMSNVYMHEGKIEVECIRWPWLILTTLNFAAHARKRFRHHTSTVFVWLVAHAQTKAHPKFFTSYLPRMRVGNVFVVSVCLFGLELLNELTKKLHFWYGGTSWQWDCMGKEVSLTSWPYVPVKFAVPLVAVGIITTQTAVWV